MKKFTKLQYTKGCFVMIVWVPLIIINKVLKFTCVRVDRVSNFLYDWVRK